MSTPRSRPAARQERPKKIRPWRAALAILVATLTCASPAAAQSDADAPQHQLVGVSHGVTVKANLFSYCRSVTPPAGVGTGACSDGPATATATRLPVHRNGSVIIATGVPVTEVVARYADSYSVETVVLPVTALDTSRRRFAVTLPASPPLTLLLVDIRYSDIAGADGSREAGSAGFSIGLREHRHLVRPTAVTARAGVSCRATTGGARRCRLTVRGTIRRPAGSRADCRAGRILIRVFTGERRVLRVTVATTAGCRFRLAERSFSLPRGSDRVRVETRFLGSPTLAARSAPAVRIDVD